MLSIDFSSLSHGLATDNITKAKLNATIDLVLANALHFLPILNDSYDFVFIDGMKRRTKDFLQLVWDKVPAG
jgi:predicted O-methyltransferase YrrM